MLPDGTTIAIQIRRWSNVYMLDVTVTATALRNGGLAGLCGTNDGKKNNDLGGKFGNYTEGEGILYLRSVLHSPVCDFSLLPCSCS